VEANLVTLNETFRLPFLPDLIARKLAGPEQSALDDAGLDFHAVEYQRLRRELQAAHEVSPLPELPDEETRAALNDLLIRLRLGFPSIPNPQAGQLIGNMPPTKTARRGLTAKNKRVISAG
jgi:hypothetical protein